MFSGKIEALKAKKLFRELRDRRSPQGTRIAFDGREYINFSSNDYLGLANHPFIIERVKQALDSYGFGAGASRLLGGGSSLPTDLEARVAQFKKTESAAGERIGLVGRNGSG